MSRPPACFKTILKFCQKWMWICKEKVRSAALIMLGKAQILGPAISQMIDWPHNLHYLCRNYEKLF